MDAATRKKLEEIMATPEWRADSRELRINTVAAIMEPQFHECEIAIVKVERDADVVKLTWEFKPSRVADPEQMAVVGSIRIVDLRPDPETIEIRPLENPPRGNGSITLRLKPGVSYSFLFMFVPAAKELFEPEEMKGVHFIIGIPLSREDRALLAKAKAMEQNPEERIKEHLESFAKKQDMFATVCEETIARIKAKGLSPEEEQRRIEEFRDFAAQAKDKYEM